jgi:6-phosphogluconolactonase (cycloisomerase 2 family)
MRRRWFNVWPALAIILALSGTHLSAEFAYVANEGDDTVSGYTINPATGVLTPVEGSPFPTDSFPKSVAVDPSGRFVYTANFFGNSVSGYTINPATGGLTAIAGSPFAAGTFAQFVVVDPSGRFAYVANTGDNNVSGYTIDQ